MMTDIKIEGVVTTSTRKLDATAPYSARRPLRRSTTHLLGLAALAALVCPALSSPRAQSIPPAPSAGSILQDCPECPELIVVPGGTFLMGSVPDPFSNTRVEQNEQPQHPVTIKPFAMGRYEVTQEQWFAITGKNPASNKGRQMPVDQVSWAEIQDFIRTLNEKTRRVYRLPTEAEWEYAARAGSTTAYPQGNEPTQLDQHAWTQRNSDSRLQFVGAKTPNSFGLHDMIGNAAEWVQDCYQDNYVRAPVDGTAIDARDCRRVVRGGSARSMDPGLRLSGRSSLDARDRQEMIGFRLAMTPGAVPAPAATPAPEPSPAEIAAAREVEALRKQLEAERQRVAQVEKERALNEAALKAREQELAAEAQRRKVEEEQRLQAAQQPAPTPPPATPTPSITGTQPSLPPVPASPAATAPTQQQRDWCQKEGTTDAQTIAGCDAVIPSGVLSSGDLALAYNKRGNAYANMGQHERAIQDYDLAIKQQPTMPWPYNNRGNAYRRLGQLDRALQDYDQAIKLKPDYVFPFANRGIIYTNKGQLDRATQEYSQAIKLKPDYAEAFVGRGVAYSRLGQHDRAIQDFDQAIKLKPDYADAFEARGFTYRRKSQYDRAIQDYDQAIKLKPDHVVALANRGFAYSFKGQLDRAMLDFDQAIKLKPDFAEAFYGRGHIHRTRGQLDAAIVEYSSALRFNPKHAYSLYGRGLARRQKGDAAGGDADIAVAKSIQSNIADEFR